MGVDYEEPKLEKVDGPVHDTVETHPAYAQIGASRVSGHSYLYGSDFQHQHFITISISRSELHRGLSNDWSHALEEYIEVALSEAQWAAFVSSPNVGQGVQCTLRHKDMKGIPQIPAAKDRQEQFDTEMRVNVKEAREHIAKAVKMIENSKLSQKDKDKLLSELGMADRDISSSVGFIAEQFGEHMEKVTEHAKAEVNAYIQGTIMRAGLTALQAPAPFSLPDKSKD